DFDVPHGVTLKGRVTDKATGQPLRAAVEYFMFADNPNLRSLRTYVLESAVTADDGTYSLVALPGRGLVTAKLDELRSSLCLTGVGADRIKGLDPKTRTFDTPGRRLSLFDFNAFGAVEPTATDQSVACDL